MSNGIVIIGAGYAGVSAARAARDAGYAEPITLIGDDPAWPYERPPLSKWDAEGPCERPIVEPETFTSQRIDLLRGARVARISPNEHSVTLASGRALGYSKLLLATGARARLLDPPHPNAPSFLTLRSLADAQTLSAKVQTGDDVLIIGGGFIGLELAASLRARRAFVHVVEAAPRILSRALPPEITDKIHALHVANGIMVHKQTTIRAFEGNIAHLSNGQTARADHVIVGIGSTPNTDLAAAAGLDVQNGIVVNAAFATSVPDIFAAGDCCAAPVGNLGPLRQESWAVAGDQGRRAGQIMAGAAPDVPEPPWFWSDQYDQGVQVAGIPDPEADTIQRKTDRGCLLCAQIRADHSLAWAAGIGNGNSVGRDITLIKKLMQKEIAVPPDAFADPQVSLKSLLKAGVAT